MNRALAATFFVVVMGLRYPAGDAASARRAGPSQQMAKAFNTVLPEVKFDGANLKDVISFLSERGGVNIIIDPTVFAQAATPAPSTPVAEKEKDRAAGEKTSLAEEGDITLHLKNVPLRVVLKYVLRYKNLRYIVDDYAIVIVPVGSVLREEMVTETFGLRAGNPAGPTATLQRRVPSAR